MPHGARDEGELVFAQEIPRFLDLRTGVVRDPWVSKYSEGQYDGELISSDGENSKITTAKLAWGEVWHGQ